MKDMMLNPKFMAGMGFLQGATPQATPPNTAQNLMNAMQLRRQYQRQQEQDKLQKLLTMAQIQKYTQPSYAPTTAMKNAQALGLKPGTEEYNQYVRNFGKGANVQEWQYYNSLPPEDQKRYREMKRSQPGTRVVEVNMPDGSTVQAVHDPSTGRLYTMGGQKMNAGVPGRELPPSMESGQSISDYENLGVGQTTEEEAQAQARGQLKGSGKISEREQSQQGKERVSKTLQEVAQYYKELDEMNAVVNTQEDSFDNIMASARSSDLGQWMGRRMGTEAQSIRNKINQARPTLINHIRQAANMGAKGLDSEKELEFYLQAATDPSKDIQANMAALAILDDAYGLGTGINIADEYKNKLKEEYESNNDEWVIEEVE